MKRNRKLWMILGMFLVAAAAFMLSGSRAEASGPYNGDDDTAYIQIGKVKSGTAYPKENDSIYLWTARDGVKWKMNHNEIVYNKKENTLTIKKLAAPDHMIYCHKMGSSFKIKVVGTSRLQGITISDGDVGMPNHYRTNALLKGSGKLILNQNKKSKAALALTGGETKSKMTIRKGVKLVCYEGKKAGSFSLVVQSKVKKPLVIKGKYNGSVKKQKYAGAIWAYATAKVFKKTS